MSRPIPVLVEKDRVVVLDGISKGLVGWVRGPADPFGKTPSYRIEFGGLLRDRVIRADFLQKVEEVCP